MKVEIIALLETSDHDGYCSGEDCVYESKITEHVLDIPETYTYKQMVELLPKPMLTNGSNYCGIDEKSEEEHLERHGYRYIIKSVKILDD